MICVKIYSIVLKSPKDCEHTGAWTMWRISCRGHFDCIFTNYFEDAIKSVDGFLSNGRQAIITSRGKASSWTSDDLIRQSIYSPQGPNEFNTLWPCYNVWRRRNGPSLVQVIGYSVLSHCTDQYWLNFNYPLTKNISEIWIKHYCFHTRKCIWNQDWLWNLNNKHQLNLNKNTVVFNQGNACRL